VKYDELELNQNENDEFCTVKYDEFPKKEDFLIPIFVNGEIVKEYSFEEVKENAKNSFLI